MDAQGLILEINAEGERLFGYAAEELRGRAIEFLIPRRFRDAHRTHRADYMAAPLRRLMGAGLNLYGLRKGGVEFPLDIMINSVPEREGRIMIAAVRDTTEQRRATAEAEALAERLRLSADAAGMGYWTYDETTDEFWCDAVCASLFGGKPEDFPRGGDVRSRVLAEDREPRRIRGRESLQRSGRYESDFRVVHPDESIRWLHDLGKYVAYEGVQGNRFAGVTFDITARKEMERKQSDLIRSLQESLREIKVLRGLLPICSHCKKIRDDQGFWQQLEVYIHEHSGADFSHGICPDCFRNFYPEIDALREKGPEA